MLSYGEYSVGDESVIVEDRKPVLQGWYAEG